VRMTRTGRGFRRADFKDANGEECSIQKSSSACADLLWLGQNNGSHHPVTGSCLARMHLTREMARRLAVMLGYFADNGELPTHTGSKRKARP